MERPEAYNMETDSEGRKIISFETTLNQYNPVALGEQELYDYLADNKVRYSIYPKTTQETYIYGLSLIFEDEKEAALCYLKYCV